MHKCSAEIRTPFQPGRVLLQSNMALLSFLFPSFTYENPSVSTAGVVFDAPRLEHVSNGLPDRHWSA